MKKDIYSMILFVGTYVYFMLGLTFAVVISVNGLVSVGLLAGFVSCQMGLECFETATKGDKAERIKT